MLKGNMDKRILELALEALVSRRNAIEAEIAEIRAELEGRAPSVGPSSKAASVTRRRRPRTAAERKAQSQRMKAYWANRRAEAAKKAAAATTTVKRPKAGK
jgi:hypothetical protein